MEQIKKAQGLIFLTVVFFLMLIAMAIITYEHMPRPMVTELAGFTPRPKQRAGDDKLYPNKELTPGSINVDITQSNINKTLCSPQWSTKTVRPPVSYTNPLKIKQIALYGYTAKNPMVYQEDHLIPLELGGSPTDSRNLWPEPIEDAKKKDTVENYLKKRVCANLMTLDNAQKAIVDDWYMIYLQSRRETGSAIQ